MADDSAPPEQASDMPAATETLTCKACGRTLASISTEGDLRPHGALDEGCALCKDMVMHCNEYEEVKGYFKELEHRRDDYRPRQLALEVVHQAQMHLGNFIHEVVAQETSDDDEVPGVLSEPQPGQQIEIETPPVEVADAPPRRRKRSLSPQSSPGARKRTKRPRLSELARRVTFDPSVVFRDAEAVEKRVDAEFSRNSDGYSPGRYAAPEGSEWLDTSGSSLKETQFFGVQKRGKKWVPTKEGLEMDEEWESAGQDEDVAGGETGGSEEMAAIEEVDADQADRRYSQVEGLIQELGAEPSSTVALLHRSSPTELDASNQGPVPDLEPSSEGATSATVRIDEHHSINDEVTPSETQLPVVLHDSAPVEREPNEKMHES